MWKAREIEETVTSPTENQSGVDEHVSVSDLPLYIQRLLRLRGVSLSDSDLFLNPKINTLKNPLTMMGMDKAVERLSQAFEKGEKVAVYGDFDLDGTSGLALLYQGFTALGFKDVGRYQPKRLTQGYGLHFEGLKELSERGYTVVVTVDVGITAIETCKKAKDLPIDLIITDHHLPEKELPQAFTVINPNQEGDTSGLGYLSGAGVGFYLLRALKRGFVERGWKAEAERCDLKEALEFFTIATLTDMVPLVEDNRALVKMGLQKISQTNKHGLKKLLKELKLDNKPLNSQDVAIRFAPKLNALSRMESEVLPIDLYLVESEDQAEHLVEVVHRNNGDRVRFQNEAFNEALLKAAEQADWPFVFVASPSFHRGVVGIVASKLCETFGKPAFVGSVDQTSELVVGSARRPEDSNVHLVEMLHSATEFFERAGGHAAAAGFEFKAENLENIINSFRNHFLLKGFASDPLPTFYDLEVDLKEINNSFIKWLDQLEPFGAGFEAPIFCFRNVTVVQCSEMKGGHLKLKVKSENGGGTFEAVIFSPRKEFQAKLPYAKKIDLLGELQKNSFRGFTRTQILVHEIMVLE